MKTETIYDNQIFEGLLWKPYGQLLYSLEDSHKILYADNKVVQLYGCENFEEYTDYIVDDFSKLMHPDDWRIMKDLMDFQLSGTDQRYDYFRFRIISKQEEVRHIEGFGHIVSDEKGKLYYYLTLTEARQEEYEKEDYASPILFSMPKIDELMKRHEEERRIEEERTVYARLHAITGNFICVYVVDPETGNYHEFSATEAYEMNYAQPTMGKDFFAAIRAAARLYSHPDDCERVISQMTKENVISGIRQKGIFILNYRIMMDGRPLYVQLTGAMVEEKDGPRLIIGLNDIDATVRQREIDEEIARQKEIYDQITVSLAEQYDTLYYIDIETSTYFEISSTDDYKKLNVPATGNDFFAESRRSIRRYVHPEDQDKALNLHYKDVMLNNLKNRNSFSLAWRLVINGQVRHIRHTEILSKDEKHIIVCIENIDAEVQSELTLKADQKKSATYTQIAERLADHYDLIYYVDCASLHYAELSTKRKSGELKIQDEGADFFRTAGKNIDRLIYRDDRNRIRLFLDKDNLISQLENRRQLTEDYRMVLDSGKTQYTRMTVTYSSDYAHFIICVENRDEDVRREKEQLKAITTANELARRDELTRIRNKTAYKETEIELQEKIDKNCEPFGLVVCDINGLKIINDTEGHKAGDVYIQSACQMIRRVFRRSQVFRIGGDEFVVVLKGKDYEARERLLDSFKEQVQENLRMGEGPVVSSGMARYQPQKDRYVQDVFDRADAQMYEDKSWLKEQKLIQESHVLKKKANFRVITEDRRLRLETLYKAFEVVAEGAYLFLCDMRFDYSRWSKNAVDTFGLPSEYMYGAGDIWANQIHPDDRANYHKGIDEIFSGNASGHDLQYRVKRLTGEYDVCTCRGTVIRDPNGEPDYFVGTIRNHGIQGHIDALTGFRNQYGFFEDLDSYIKRNTRISVVLFGISKFSEINEMYGYHFGNRVLQSYARSAFNATGKYAHIYRIDGTKFAIISSSLSVSELEAGYNRFRAFLHEDFIVDGRKVLIDLHCGAIRVDSFDIDSQTVYACLNYADEESKYRKQGNLVEFFNDISDENHRRLEKIYAIRASIKLGHEGFYLLFQPVVDSKTEKLIGAEALLRWKNDYYGMVPPDEFIPILEADPLFPELGEWIIRESILAAKQIQARYPDFVINVNLSYTQLEKSDFVDMVFRNLNELEYPPEQLCLEITERCRLLDLELLKNVVVNLASRGVRVALDDFGTGFSSMGLLKEIPFNIIKIDRSFVKNIEEDNVDREIIRNIADLANIFGSKVCVEGVETAVMREILLGYRVASFQGYYYAKPLTLEDFLEWR